ncbi:HET-domain-containing protein [Pyrenochaeta sp. DS3sAY3a]|nr:HET-domain-containing protein [Pyrenochaeta sp. DS3sAY3a]
MTPRSQIRPGMQKAGFYKPLINDEIRLIRLDRGSEPIISCKVVHVPLSQDPVFWALSYTWGSLNNKEKILVNDTPFPITLNLFEALLEIRKQIRSLQDKKTIPLLWIDAICLDQGDDREKSIEVPRMSLIYGKCERVLVWIGLVVEEEEKAIKKVVTKLQVFNTMAEKSKKNVETIIRAYSNSNSGPMAAEQSRLLASLRNIAASPWFKRIWTVQETALASHDPIMLLGPSTFSFETYFGLRKSLEAKCSLNPAEDSTSEALCHSLVRTKRREITDFSFLSNTTELQRLGTAYEMLQLLHFTSALEATMPHDYIYGLLGLLRQARLPYELIPRYHEPFELAYYDCVRYIISQTKDLSILSLGRLGTLNGIPSWVPDFRKKVPRGDIDETAAPEFKFMDRRTLCISGIVLGEFSYKRQPPVNASATSKVPRPTASACILGVPADGNPENWFKLQFSELHPYNSRSHDNEHEEVLKSFMTAYNRLIHNDDASAPTDTGKDEDSNMLKPLTRLSSGQFVVIEQTSPPTAPAATQDLSKHLICILPQLNHAFLLELVDPEEDSLRQRNVLWNSTAMGGDRAQMIEWILSVRDRAAGAFGGDDVPFSRRDLERVRALTFEDRESYKIVGQVAVEGRNRYDEARTRHPEQKLYIV